MKAKNTNEKEVLGMNKKLEGVPGFVISVNNIKGGVAKSTTAVTIATVTANLGFKTLLIDNDPQGSASSSLNMRDRNKPQIGDILLSHVSVKDSIFSTDIEGLDIIQAHLDLINDEEVIKEAKLYDKKRLLRYLNDLGVALTLEQEALLPSYEHMDFLLKDIVGDVKNEYDFIFIDNSPYYNPLVENSLYAAEYIVVPIKLDKTALEGYSFLIEKLKKVKEVNRNLKIIGILPTMYRKATYLHNVVYENLVKEVDEYIFDRIPLTVRVEEAPYYGGAVTSISPNVNASIKYIENTKKMINIIFEENGIDYKL